VSPKKKKQQEARMWTRVVRPGLATTVHRGSQPARASFSMWDRVRPSLWHPVATLEQSMMELDRLTSHMLSAPFNYAQSMLPRMHVDDDDFFKDLGLPTSMDNAKHKAKDKMDDAKHKVKDKMEEAKHLAEAKMESMKEKMGDAKDSVEDAAQMAATGSTSSQPGDQSYSSYSYSSSTIFDENGHAVTSMRRRYEDSAGRLKAVHERQIDGKKVKSVWHKKSKDDKGKHKTICQATDADEFEEEWKKTLFGQAEDQRQVSSKQANATPGIEYGGTGETKPQGVVQAEKESEHITPGPDYGAAEKAPEKEPTEEGDGVTKEAHDKSREQAIAEGAKTQEEETTPPKYTSSDA